jgi:uncharacterized surface protein with fasciclin (FAS1) repeats
LDKEDPMRLKSLMIIPFALAATACADAGDPVAVEPTDAAFARGAVTPAAAAPAPTIVDVAIAVNAESGEFSTLIAAVQRAGFVDALSARGQRTVFAPTDAAFEAAGLTADNIETVPLDALRDILLYHVAPGSRDSGEVLASDQIRMANGGFTTIWVEHGRAYINDAQIVAVDIEASNGIIHVIDGVLLP